MALHNVLVVVGEVAVHVSNVLTGYFFDDQSSIVGDKEATVAAFTFTRGTSGEGYQVILVINAKSITEVPEDLGAILLELEMTRQIFPVEKVIVDLDLGASLKVVWQQHHGGRHLAELIDLISRNKNREPVRSGVESYFYTVSGQESEKGNSNLVPLRTLVMHLLARGEKKHPTSSAPNKDCSKQPPHTAPHTPPPGNCMLAPVILY